MTVSSRLALAMVLLVVVTSCMVSAFAYYFVAEAAPRAALISIISAALAGGGIAAVLAVALAVGVTKLLLKPPPSAPEAAIAGAEREQARAYQALADRERMAQAIIENALDAFVQTDGSCVILDWSPHAEALMGWTRAEAVGRSVEELLFPEPLRVLYRQWLDQFLSEAEGDAVGGRYETPLLQKDGREFFAEVSFTALRRNDGHIINAFVRDITAKRAAEEQLIQAQKMESVGQLTGGIAHDFNNMLTVITGTIEILADGVKHDPALASIARMINDAADRASQLTANLLAFARKQPLRPLETDVNALIEEVVKLLSPTLGQADRDRDRIERSGLAGAGRSRPAHLGAGQSRDQRPRRHARWAEGCCSGRGISRAMRMPRRWSGSAPATTSPSRSSIAAPAFHLPSATGFSSRSFRPSSSAPAPGLD